MITMLLLTKTLITSNEDSSPGIGSARPRTESQIKRAGIDTNDQVKHLLDALRGRMPSLIDCLFLRSGVLH